MRTAGVDLSTAPERTALATIEWDERGATVTEPALGLDDSRLLQHLPGADWVGIDAPFGWPKAMVNAIKDYTTTGRWPAPDQVEFRHRRTDRFVRAWVERETGEKLWPLSPACDRIGLTAVRLARLREAAFERSGIRFDRAGADGVVEVYPAASLVLWGLERAGYKSGQRSKPSGAGAAVREELLASIESQAPWLAWEGGARETCVESDHALDAVLCSLTARAAALGLSQAPWGEDFDFARAEGWIHVPARGSLGELAGAVRVDAEPALAV